MRTFRDLPVVDTNRVQQKRRHQPGHTTTNNTNLLVLLASDERRIRFLGLKVSNTVKPCTVRVVDRGQGVSLAEGVVGQLDGFRGTDDAEVGKCVKAAFGWCVLGRDPDESGSELKRVSLRIRPSWPRHSRHVVRGVAVRRETTDFMVRLGVVVDTAFAVDEDDVSSQRFGTVIRDVEVVGSASLDTGWAESEL